MTNQEALHKLEVARDLYAWNAEDLDVINLAIAALEKQEPMEVTEIHCDEYYCPSCGSENMADCYKVGDNYCPRCGQALKTEEKDENSD